ncbi:MAG TPA: HD domain-containing protein [Acidimicrobiia bacterium]|nr:HD domain-containing protein [Acidimicrobiia bacterium]
MDPVSAAAIADAMARAGAAPHRPSGPGAGGAAPALLGARFDQALLYAAAAHRTQTRKGTAVPYLSHLLGVASIVLTAGGNEDQAIAALLHDTVEDCGVEHEPVIGELFGDAVLGMVLACSDSRQPAGAAKADWRERKGGYLHHLDDLPAGDPALLVSCADKVHNAEAILADLAAGGLPFWDRFPGKSADDLLWYYGALASFFTEALPGDVSARLRRTVDDIGRLHRRLAGEPEPS